MIKGKLILMLCVSMTVLTTSYAKLSLETTYSTNQHLTVGEPSYGKMVDMTVSGGLLVVPVTTTAICRYLPPADSFFDVSNDGTSWGTNTIVSIFKVNNVPIGENPTIRQTLMAVASASEYTPGFFDAQRKGMEFFVNQAGGYVQLHLVAEYYGLGPHIDPLDPESPRGPATGVAEITLDNVGATVLPNTWYFVGVSWKYMHTPSDPNDKNVAMTAYLRPIADITGTAAAFKANNSYSVGATDWNTQYTTIGHRGTKETGTSDYPLDGHIDLLRVYKGEFLATVEDYAKMFDMTVSNVPYNCMRAIESGQKIAGDFNSNCYVDLKDFATLAATWMDCMTPGQSGCQQTWNP